MTGVQTCALPISCWNGLYRVNLNGEFNVPIGTKQKVILDTDNFKEVSNLLKNVELMHSDFEDIIDSAKENDLLFIDPPYTVTHNYNGFIKYNEELFSKEDQVRLRDCLVSAVDRGVKVLSTNANHRYIKDLYRSEFFYKPVKRSSVIAADRANRGSFGELLLARNT